MNTSKKLFLGFSVVICLALVVGAIGIVGMQELLGASVSMYENQIKSLEYTGMAAAKFREIRNTFNQLVTSSWYDDKKGALDAKEKYKIHIAEFSDLLDKSYKAAYISDIPQFFIFYFRIMRLFNDAAIPLFDDVIDASIYDIPDHYNKLYIRVKMTSINEVADQIETLILGMTDLNSAVAEQTSRQNAETTQLLIALQAVLLAFAVVIAGFVAFFITRSIAVPIKESALVLGELSQGHFKARVKGNYKGELALIKNSVNDTAEKLELYLKNTIIAERASHESNIARERADAVREALTAGLVYANKIQRNILPSDITMKNAFSDYSVIWEPRDVVGGDIYWMRQFDEGVTLCIADCTGHGTPGALLTMLVVSILEATVRRHNYHDTAGIIWRLEQRLVSVFGLNQNESQDSNADSNSSIRDGCDLAVIFIAKDGNITLSSGNTNVFVCNGKKVQRFRGQKIYVGEGNIKSKEDIKVIDIPFDPANKFYIASDGLFDQWNESQSTPFGYKKFSELILQNHNEKQSVISARIWDAFEEFRGESMRLDDFELITFKPNASS